MMAVPALYLPYEDLDKTNELHLILENLSPTQKESGRQGQLLVEVGYRLAG